MKPVVGKFYQNRTGYMTRKVLAISNKRVRWVDEIAESTCSLTTFNAWAVREVKRPKNWTRGNDGQLFAYLAPEPSYVGPELRGKKLINAEET